MTAREVKMPLIRLDRFICSQLPGVSRSGVKELCKKGQISVNGETERSPERKIDPYTAEVAVLGRRITYKEHLYIMLNKPAGVVCATRDGLSQTVIELLPPELRRQGLFPAGRLDKDTVGFVLITDDGELAHRMLSPRSHVPKTYFVRHEKPICPGAGEAFAAGLTLLDGTKCLPAELICSQKPDECTVVLHEGMFHQIKRMFEALDNNVIFLKRIAIGGVKLDNNLPYGGVRELKSDEVKALTSAE